MHREVSENDYYREHPPLVYDDEDVAYPEGLPTSEGEDVEMTTSIEEIPPPKQDRKSRSRRRAQNGRQSNHYR